jgi:predicted RNA binding protein YcfA (HicA-like mRNA interferase family)
MKPRKLLKAILAGSRNVRFDDMVALVRGFGFDLSRVNGSHHIFVHPDVEELVNL